MDHRFITGSHHVHHHPHHRRTVSFRKADGAQLKRAQQLMGQAALLQSVVNTNAGKVAPSQLAAALNPKVRLPAAFEQHMRAWRNEDAVVHADQHGQQRRTLAARLAQLEALEQGLAAAIDRAGPSDTPPPFSPPAAGGRTALPLPALGRPGPALPPRQRHADA